MKLSLFSVIALISAGLIGCSVAQQNKTESIELDSQPMQTGYMLMGDELVEVEYYIDGDYAVLDAHSRVPKSLIRSDYEGIGLTAFKGTKTWPSGIVPYKVSIMSPGTDPSYVNASIANATQQFARAGIQLVPFSGQPHFLDIRIINYASPDCSQYKGGCPFSGASNTLGFGSPGQGYVRPQPNSGGIVWVIDDPNWPALRGNHNMNKPGFKMYGLHVMLHEIGHAVGALHEQAHPSAREFLKKNPENPGRFEDLKNAEGVTPFDYKSVMLYCYDFILKSSQTNDPICALDKHPSELSAGDVEGLRKLYASEIAKRNGTPVATPKPGEAASPPKRKVGGDERSKPAKRPSESKKEERAGKGKEPSKNDRKSDKKDDDKGNRDRNRK